MLMMSALDTLCGKLCNPPQNPHLSQAKAKSANTNRSSREEAKGLLRPAVTQALASICAKRTHLLSCIVSKTTAPGEAHCAGLLTLLWDQGQMPCNAGQGLCTNTTLSVRCLHVSPEETGKGPYLQGLLHTQSPAM